MDEWVDPTAFGPPWLARAVYFLSGGLMFAAMMQFNQQGSTDFVVNLLVIVMIWVPALCAWPLSGWYQRHEQRRRDQRAGAILRLLRAGGNPHGFSLYLRAFAITGKLPLIAKVSDFESNASPEGGGDAEAAVAQALEATAPLIALGRPGELFGAGRIATEEAAWQTDFRLLARGATNLVMVPGDTRGVLHEIDWILKQQLWSKLILIMPTENKSHNWAGQWETWRTGLADTGLDLPTYCACGVAFKVGQDGKLALFASIGHKKLSEVMAELVANRGLRPDEDLLQCSKCGYAQRRTKPGNAMCQFCLRTVVGKLKDAAPVSSKG